jgi:hypothetical protein
MRNVTLCLLASAVAAALVTPAHAQTELMPAPYSSTESRPTVAIENRPVGADDYARDLVSSLSDLQHDIAGKIPGKQGADLYQRGQIALDAAVRLREAIQDGAKPEAVQRRLAQLNQELQPLLDAVKTIRSLQKTVARINAIERRLEVAIAPGARDPKAVISLVHRLAVRSEELQRGAWHAADQNPVFQELAEDVEAFARTVAEYHFDSQDPDASWEDLLAGYRKVRLAWLAMVTHLEAFSPRQLPAVYGELKYMARVYERLHRQLYQEEQTFTPSDIPSSVRPSVPAVP